MIFNVVSHSICGNRDFDRPWVMLFAVVVIVIVDEIVFYLNKRLFDELLTSDTANKQTYWGN